MFGKLGRVFSLQSRLFYFADVSSFWRVSLTFWVPLIVVNKKNAISNVGYVYDGGDETKR